MTNDTAPAIDVAHLTKRYDDVLAVDDISFTVRMGELFAFVGPNGAGKTTTVEIIDTIRRPTSGTVRLLGMDVTKRKRDILPRIGVLPQGFTSFDRITVAETIQYYSRLFSRRNTDVQGLIRLVNLEDKSEEQFQNLSGGLKQRLGIAVALVNDPEVVFLDEPTTGLDPRARREVWEVLLGLKKKGKTVFITTHYMEEAELLADTVAIIAKGRIIAMGSPEEIIQANAKYLVLTLKCADETALEIVRIGTAVTHVGVYIRKRRDESPRLGGEGVVAATPCAVEPPDLSLGTLLRQRVKHGDDRCGTDTGADQQYGRLGAVENEAPPGCGDV